MLLCMISGLHAQFVVSPLTTGTNQEIDELFVDTLTNALFVSGNFTQAGNLNVEWSAIWTGNTWEPSGFRVGAATNVYYKGELYTSGIGGAGYFQAGMPIYQCCWSPMMKRLNNTNQWIPIGQDTSKSWTNVPYNNYTGEMYDMEVEGDTMYLLGGFSRMGNVQVRNIAKFDGQNFYPFPPPDTALGAVIICAKFYKGELYIGGNFDSQTDPDLHDIAKWNGHSWENLGSPISGPMTTVGRMEIYNGELVVAGGFSKAWGDKGDGIMSWDGVQWKDLGTGMKMFPSDMMEYEGELYVTGQILQNPTPIKHVAKWNGSTWSGIGIDTVTGGISAIAQWNGDLYFGGGFWNINGVDCKNIARYSLATGLISPILPQNNIQAYPNPASTSVHITSQNAPLHSIALYNAWGQVLQKHAYPPATQQATLSVEALPQGVYFLQIATEKGVEVLKLLHE